MAYTSGGDWESVEAGSRIPYVPFTEGDGGPSVTDRPNVLFKTLLTNMGIEVPAGQGNQTVRDTLPELTDLSPNDWVEKLALEMRPRELTLGELGSEKPQGIIQDVQFGDEPQQY